MNKRLLILSGIAIIAVVANHASHVGFLAMFWWTDRYLPVSVPNFDQMGSLSYYGLVAQQKLALFSVPSFLLVSGVFIAYAARGEQSRLSWSMIQKRIFNLIPPYLIWSSVFILGDIILGTNYSIRDFVLSLVTIRNSPFFFVPLLMLFFLISPIIAPLAKTRWKLLLLVAIVVQILAIIRAYLRVTGVEYPFSQVINFVFSSQIVEYFFFYALGLILGFRLTQTKQALFKVRWGLFVSTLVFAILAVAEAEWIFQQYGIEIWRSTTLSVPTFLYEISFILCFLSFDHVNIPFSNLLYRLGAGTLAIYLLHSTVLLFIPKIIYHIAPIILGYQILLQPLLIAVAIGIPVLLMDIVKRSPVRKYYRFLFG